MKKTVRHCVDAIWTQEEEAKLEAMEKFKDIVRAYQILRDPAKRRRYDLHGETG